jgi:hypothetical protein
MPEIRPHFSEAPHFGGAVTASLASVLLFIAEDLDARGYAFSGAVRQAARRISELEVDVEEAEQPCEGCGAPIKQKLGQARISALAASSSS